MLRTYTVNEGQRVAVWDKDGRREMITGPKRIALWGRRVQPLQPYVAGPTQYLAIHCCDGRVVHQRGPSVVWMDPVEHAQITVTDAITLSANEALVVYRQQEGRVERRVVRGPELFVPEAQEWLHEFRWHGADPKDPRRKVPRGLVFHKLRVIPDQMYVDVENVRTADDALLAVKLMIFFELMEIELMLDQTHDPIADFINAVSADVIDLAATLTFEQFKEQTERLNARESYGQLAQRAGRIGYRINKVVYRGYDATAKLQAMHDNAIESRTRLKLEAETEAQAQDLADLKLGREQERVRRQQDMQQAGMEHENLMKRMAHEEQLRQQQAEHELANQAEQRRAELLLQRRKTRDHQQIAFLQAVQELQVDMTRYLVARHEKPDRRIRIDGGQRAQLHLHEPVAG